MKNKTKRILVAGGAGFLGANLCRALLEQGHHVMVLDNLSTGKKENIAELLKHPHF
ncbi:NAD-dependent epimerase/dehydratase family protein, partial [Myxococcota bacterium]|nr:NAD-dependent epimerase/dehydratase family protein [Myxococcota bacterium]